MNLSKENSNFLKLVGVISMALDHIGKYFYPQYLIFQILGRIAFPIFAFQLCVGYQKTSNKKRYIKRLLIFGIITQPIYYLLTRRQVFYLRVIITKKRVLRNLKWSILKLMSTSKSSSKI